MSENTPEKLPDPPTDARQWIEQNPHEALATVKALANNPEMKDAVLKIVGNGNPAFFDMLIEGIHERAGEQMTAAPMRLVREAWTNDWRQSTSESLVATFGTWDQLSENSQRVYQLHMLSFVRYLDGKSLFDVERPDIIDYAHFMEHRRKPKLAATSRKAHLSAITSFYKWLMYHDPSVKVNPAHGVLYPRIKNRNKGNKLSDAQVWDFLLQRGTPRETAMAYLLVFTGARNSELRSLVWSDIDFPNTKITLLGTFAHIAWPWRGALAVS